MNRIWFFWFSQDIRFFRKTNYWNFYCWDLCARMQEGEVGMAARCRCSRFIYHRILSLLWKNAFSSNLEGEGKQKFLSVPTMLEYSYQFKNILIGYAFSNISKIISLYLRPQFYYTFCAGFLYQKMLYIMLQRNIHYIQIISFVR